jgi:hypothetical protein
MIIGVIWIQQDDTEVPEPEIEILIESAFLNWWVSGEKEKENTIER